MRTVFWHPVRDEHYEPVKPNLSVSPADMERMTAQGKSISTSSLENFIYFNGDQLDGLPLDLKRGQDMNTIWEASQAAKSKVRALARARSRKLHDLQVEQTVAKGGAL